MRFGEEKKQNKKGQNPLFTKLHAKKKQRFCRTSFIKIMNPLFKYFSTFMPF